MKLIIYIFLLFNFPALYGQASSVQLTDTLLNERQSIHIIVPVAMLGYGLYSIVNKDLREVNYHLRHEILEINSNTQSRNYDFVQYMPLEAVYGLNALGIKGKHNFVDRTFIYGLSNFIMSKSVANIKTVSHQLRPDGSNYRSFPSGHTATAFSAAEFMRLEYKDVSPWYGIGAYTIAGTAGALRMYGNQHWLSDVIAGAGVGILSTDLAYWGYPKLKELIARKTKIEHNSNITILPSFGDHTFIFTLYFKPK